MTRRALIGLIGGLITAAVLGLFATGMSVIDALSGQRGWADLPPALLFYFVTAPPAGAVIGAMFPLARTRIGAAALGGLATAVLFAIFAWPLDTPETWARDLPQYAFFGAFAGAMAIYWKYPELDRLRQ